MTTAPTVAIVGGGQLGRMLALAGYPLGLGFRFLDPSPGSPASQVGEQIDAPYDDPAALAKLAQAAAVVTYEFENVPVSAARQLERYAPVYPPPAALEVAQDRLSEKTLFDRLGIPTPLFAAVDSEDDLHAAAQRTGLPAVLKTRRMGYDGKGQMVLREPADIPVAWRALAGGGVPLILEAFVPLDREVSVIAVRSRAGEVAFYPLVQNRHEGGILRESLAPAPGAAAAAVQTQAEEYARRVMEATGYVGVLAIEFFDVGGRLIANEMAPRVHNSGHWTIEGAQTSQFENHLRAVLGLPLGSTTPVGVSAMLNLIGRAPPLEAMLAIPGAHVHLYGKSARSGRKIGHLTLLAPDERTLAEPLARARRVVAGA